ncbi:hypothetical protein K2173_004283 [Erythroxylum novogranatense]|uniref:Uncharacterized protein n=1 Tax=Erythroxylum novogranatense TaxID=1862640 RepID=A0AAV8U584_9ROSI|nr:hypothetical protein K2173_004283 [Erythroxylum novogranatense]
MTSNFDVGSKAVAGSVASLTGDDSTEETDNLLRSSKKVKRSAECVPVLERDDVKMEAHNESGRKCSYKDTLTSGTSTIHEPGAELPKVVSEDDSDPKELDDPECPTIHLTTTYKQRPVTPPLPEEPPPRPEIQESYDAWMLVPRVNRGRTRPPASRGHSTARGGTYNNNGSGVVTIVAPIRHPNKGKVIQGSRFNMLADYDPLLDNRIAAGGSSSRTPEWTLCHPRQAVCDSKGGRGSLLSIVQDALPSPNLCPRYRTQRLNLVYL